MVDRTTKTGRWSANIGAIWERTNPGLFPAPPAKSWENVYSPRNSRVSA